jgi:hypothetical protein
MAKNKTTDAQKRSINEHEVRIFVRECLDRDDIDLPSLKNLSDDDLEQLASAIRYSSEDFG